MAGKSLKGRHLTGMTDLSVGEVNLVLKTAMRMKKSHYAGTQKLVLKNKVLAMIFQKPSTRTRVSFEAGIAQLGGVGIYLSASDMQLGRGETVADTARVISRYADCIMARVFSHDDIIALAGNSRVPVINGLSDLEHPCQVLADLQTIAEKEGRLKGLKLAYVGDGANNMAQSLMVGCAMMGMHVAIGTPKGCDPNPDIAKKAVAFAKKNRKKLEVLRDPLEAVAGADIIYTDVWASMGQEKEHAKRVRIFKPYQVNSKLVAKAKKNAIVMHCLPAHRGEEITDEVIDGPRSVVFDQAENRLHVQKAIMTLVV